MRSHKKTALLSILLCFTLFVNAQELIPYRKGDLWGFTDKNKKKIIAFKYDKVTPFEKGFAYVHKGNLKGIINNNGKEILPLKNWISCYKVPNKNAFVVINSQKLYGVINGSGNIVVPFGKYDTMERFNKYGISIVKNGELLGVINHKGTVILPMDNYYNMYLDKKNELFHLNKDNKSILFSLKEGKIISNKKYNTIFNLKETNQYFIVSNNGLLGVINYSGEEILPIMYDDIVFGNNATFIVKKNNLTAIVNTNNNTIAQGYDAILPYNNGFAKIIKNGKYGLIDSNGKLIIELGTYDDITKIDGEILIVKKEGKLGIITKQGKEIVAPKYEKISNFRGGFAIVVSNEKYGILNTQGKEIKPCKFEWMKKVTDKGLKPSIVIKDSLYTPTKKVLISFKENNNYGLINTEGKLLLKASYQKIDLAYAHHNVLVSKRDPKNNTIVKGYYNIIKEKFTTPLIYKQAKPFDSKQFSLAEVQLQDNKRTAINAQGKEVITPDLHLKKITQIAPNTLIIKSNTYGLYNTIQEKYIIPLGKYIKFIPSKNANYFCVGTRVTEANSSRTKHGVVDKNGKEIVPLKYDKIEGELIGDFIKNNIIKVRIGKEKGFIDTNGTAFFE